MIEKGTIVKPQAITALGCALLLALVSLQLSADSARPLAPETQLAEAAALAWLGAVDRGDMPQAWRTSSALLQEAMNPQALADVIGQARKDFGAVVQRQLTSAQEATSLPGAPDGRYVVLIYQTDFENSKGVVETITPRLEDGHWRVSGYYLR